MVFDITKVLVSSAAISGIGILWLNFSKTAFDAACAIFEKTYDQMNGSYVEPEKYIRERVENISSLIKRVLEDEQKMLKAVKDGQDEKEFDYIIINQIEIICWRVKKLEEDCKNEQDLDDDDIWDKIGEFKYFCCVTEKMLKYWEDGQELLTRLCERKHFEDEKIRLFVKDKQTNEGRTEN